MHAPIIASAAQTLTPVYSATQLNTAHSSPHKVLVDAKSDFFKHQPSPSASPASLAVPNAIMRRHASNAIQLKIGSWIRLLKHASARLAFSKIKMLARAVHHISKIVSDATDLNYAFSARIIILYKRKLDSALFLMEVICG